MLVLNTVDLSFHLLETTHVAEGAFLWGMAEAVGAKLYFAPLFGFEVLVVDASAQQGDSVTEERASGYPLVSTECRTRRIHVLALWYSLSWTRDISPTGFQVTWL